MGIKFDNCKACKKKCTDNFHAGVNNICLYGPKNNIASPATVVSQEEAGPQ